ncbi:uroporphyrinogen-III synthase [soil metagenome]
MTGELVVLTVSPGAFPGLADRLRGLPVMVEERPLLTFVPPLDWVPVDRALRELRRYDALAFTSPRAAAAFIERYGATRRETRGEGAPVPTVWSGGPGTTAALAPLASPVRGAPEAGTGRVGAAAALAAAMLEAGVAGPVLFPCGEIRRDELPTRLRHEGVVVDEVVCYRSILANDAAARAAAEGAAIVVVASPSVADLLARVCRSGARPKLLAVGPTTAAAARVSGWAPAAVASRPDLESLLAGVRALLSADLPVR